MTASSERENAIDFRFMFEYLRETGYRPRVDFLIATGELDHFLKVLVETGGVKQFVIEVGVDRIIEAIGIEQFWAQLSPKQRQHFRWLAGQEKPSPTHPPE